MTFDFDDELVDEIAVALAPPAPTTRVELECTSRGWIVRLADVELQAPLRFGAGDREAVERWAVGALGGTTVSDIVREARFQAILARPGDRELEDEVTALAFGEDRTRAITFRRRLTGIKGAPRANAFATL